MEEIVLHDHNERWSVAFKKEQAVLATLLGVEEGKIHHVGSTAVAGLVAKPVIDIAVEASLFPPSPPVLACLAAAGYAYNGEGGVPGRHWFAKGLPRSFNLHYCGTGSPVVQNQVKFRDALRRSESLREAYADLKREIAQNRDIDSADYAAAKSDFIQRALAARP